MYVQSDLDALRLEEAGAIRSNMEVTGSFKFDVARRNPDKEVELRSWVGDGRILLGGSTWPGEDEVLLRILPLLPNDVKLIIAPRHFEKADAVEGNIIKAGYGCIRRSRGESVLAESDAASEKKSVFLADFVRGIIF